MYMPFTGEKNYFSHLSIPKMITGLFLAGYKYIEMAALFYSYLNITEVREVLMPSLFLL
jgi:hypothetical protein